LNALTRFRCASSLLDASWIGSRRIFLGCLSVAASQDDSLFVEAGALFKRRFTNGVENPESAFRVAIFCCDLALPPYILEKAFGFASGIQSGSLAEILRSFRGVVVSSDEGRSAL
jgi:hypothetical protein